MFGSLSTTNGAGPVRWAVDEDLLGFANEGLGPDRAFEVSHGRERSRAPLVFTMFGKLEKLVGQPALARIRLPSVDDNCDAERDDAALPAQCAGRGQVRPEALEQKLAEKPAPCGRPAAKVGPVKPLEGRAAVAAALAGERPPVQLVEFAHSMVTEKILARLGAPEMHICNRIPRESLPAADRAQAQEVAKAFREILGEGRTEESMLRSFAAIARTLKGRPVDDLICEFVEEGRQRTGNFYADVKAELDEYLKEWE